MRISSLLRRLAGDSRGATMMEYGLIIAVIAIALLSSLRWVAYSSSSLWERVVTQVQGSGLS